MKNSSLQLGTKVLELETRGLNHLRSAVEVDSSAMSIAFRKAIVLCDALKGRLIVTGMGKSGHVARKMAATFASTGLPSIFVHPGEASHGDLGMIGEQDAVLALSNSGETAELGDIIAYTHRYGIPLIAMTAKADSTLANAAKIALVLPPFEEACAITNAPTTSTTMMMALGDALAVTLLQKKGFTATDFHKFHPGGKLGAALKRVTELMHHTDMPLCAPDMIVSDAVNIISEKGFGCVGVTDDQGFLIGIITDGDLRRHFSADLGKLHVKDVMTASPKTVKETSLAAEALSLLSERKITAVFIVDEQNRPKGLLHVHDCLSVGVL